MQNVQQAGQIEAFILPDIGEGIVECEIVKWCVSEGQIIAEDDVVVEVMTDKAVVEIPAKYAGKVSKLHYAQGDIAKVHTPLFDQIISVDGTTEILDTRAENKTSDAPHASNAPSTVAADSNASTLAAQNGTSTGKAIASPAVRRLAREQNIDLSQVQGSGSKGRVLKQDLHAPMPQTSNEQAYVSNVEPLRTVAQTAEGLAQASSAPKARKVVAMRGIRAAMAKQMQQAVSSIPHFSVSDELCMDKLKALREQLKPDFAEQGVKLSFMPFFIKAMSLALLDYEEINAQLNDDASELTIIPEHNIGMAVDSKIGLLVPNIKNVQNLSVFEIAQEVNRIVELARVGKLSSQDLQGGTISISNIGTLGGITATPVINKPELAIVALGKTQVLPRFDEFGNVHASAIMTVNWSGDHRVIDGATMVRFNNLWMDYLQHPEKMLAKLR